MITTTIKAEELQIVRIHDVSDLPLKGDVQLLKGVIESIAVPDTWNSHWGPSTIAPLAIEWGGDQKPNPGVKRLLIVRQTEQGHEQVALACWRSCDRYAGELGRCNVCSRQPPSGVATGNLLATCVCGSIFILLISPIKGKSELNWPNR